MELLLSLIRLNELNFVDALNFEKPFNIFFLSVKCMKWTAHTFVII